jgi:predicted DNA-binding transcriptional regulator YafY
MTHDLLLNTIQVNRIDRLFGILTILQSRKYTSAELIAERFGISIRTVYRDIRALNEQGIPVMFHPNRGYNVMHGYFLSPVSFNTDEANALLLMEGLVNVFSDKSIQKNYTSALNKIKAVLKTGQKEKLEVLHENIKLQFPSCINNDFEYLSLLQQSISCRTMIEIDYKSQKEEVSSRKVEPIGLIFYALSWHLIGWCHSRNDYRDFKVNRILKVKDLETPFLKPDHMAVGEYMKQLPVSY